MSSKNPFTDSRNISMRLLRADGSSSGENDDQIVIEDQGDNVYHVYFRDATWDNQKTAHMVVLSGEELDTYLEGYFFLLTRDSQPFRSIQLNIPCLPIIMFKIEDLKKKSIRNCLTTILPLLSSCMKVRF